VKKTADSLTTEVTNVQSRDV